MNKYNYRYRVEFEDGTAVEGTGRTITLALSVRTEQELNHIKMYQLIPFRFLWWRFYKKLPVDNLLLTTFILKALQEETYVKDQAA